MTENSQRVVVVVAAAVVKIARHIPEPEWACKNAFLSHPNHFSCSLRAAFFAHYFLQSSNNRAKNSSTSTTNFLMAIGNNKSTPTLPWWPLIIILMDVSPGHGAYTFYGSESGYCFILIQCLMYKGAAAAEEDENGLQFLNFIMLSSNNISMAAAERRCHHAIISIFLFMVWGDWKERSGGGRVFCHFLHKKNPEKMASAGPPEKNAGHFHPSRLEKSCCCCSSGKNWQQLPSCSARCCCAKSQDWQLQQRL